MSPANATRGLLLLTLFVGGSCIPNCGAGGIPHQRSYEIIGRLLFPDDRGCGSPVASQTISWAECNAFKERVDPSTNMPYRQDNELVGGLRPLPATVALAVFARPPGETEFSFCQWNTFQTHDNGFFRAFLEVDASDCGGYGGELRVVGMASLRFTFPNSSTAAVPSGSVIAVWPSEGAEELLAENTDQSMQPPDALDGTSSYATPNFRFQLELDDPHDGAALDRAQRIDLGQQIFADTAATDHFDYIKQLLSAWATMLKLHRELRGLVGDDAYFTHAFGDVEVDGQTLSNHYALRFDDTWAYGWGTGIALFRPDTTKFLADGDAWKAARLLSSTAVLAHEFGHSIHDAFAGQSLRKDYSFANNMKRSSVGGPPGCVSDPGADGVKCRDGLVYDWGHGQNQYQELGVSFVEGVANGLGQYLLNRCRTWIKANRPVGGADPFAINMWLRDTTCDDDDGCSYHHLRYHLDTVRGLAEDGPDFAERAGGLLWLSYKAVTVGHRFVTSNSEGRWGELTCDLLDDDSDVSHAEGIANGTNRGYILDYTSKVGRILNGEDPLSIEYLEKWYQTGPVPGEYVTLELTQLLDAMANFCPSSICDSLPQRASDDDYAAVRLAPSHVAAGVSPQKLLRYLADPARGLISDTDVSALLRSNFMEDVAYGEPE